MPLQLSVAVRNAELNAIETTIGTDPILRLRTGSAPANCAAADTGTVVATLTLPTDWLAAAASGSKALSGTWEDLDADADGTVEHFRIYDSGDVACHIQGTVTVTGAGGDMTLNRVAVLENDEITVTAFTLSAGNA